MPAAPANPDELDADTPLRGSGTPPGLARRVWKAIIRPGARWMGKRQLGTKIGVLVFALCIPIMALLWQTFASLTQERSTTLTIRQGVAVMHELLELYAQLDRMRTLQVIEIGGDKGVSPRREETVGAVLAQLQRIDQIIGARPRFDITGFWTGTREQTRALVERPAGTSAARAATQVTQSLAAVHELMHRVADSSGMSTDGAAASRNLTRSVVDGHVHVMATVGEMGSQGAMMLANAADADLQARATMLGLTLTLERQIDQLRDEVISSEHMGTAAPGTWKVTQETLGRVVRQLRTQFSAETIEGRPRTHADTIGLARDHANALARDTLKHMDQLAAQRLERNTAAIASLAAIYVLGLALCAYLVAALYVSFHHALREILGGMQAMARGDLSHRVRIKGNDELAAIAQAFDRMSERLSGMTAEIRSRAARVHGAGRQVAEESQQLALRTDEQAQSVRSTASSVAEVSSAVTLNAQAARDVDQLTERLFAQAEDGNRAMADTVVAMDGLLTATTRVNDVVAVIDDVAFQTGMLALNAAVEAARAGAAGKGFAVVAGEVRQLAQRCAESADEIRQLITASTLQTQQASEKLQHVSVALDVLVNGVREASGQLRTIAAACTQQSAALQAVEGNIGNLEAITQRNASLVEESNSASMTLLTQGEALSGSVASMRLRHGSADEARELVERALMHAREVGRSQALLDFNRADGQWVDRDLFIFAFDRVGNIVVNSMRPARVGLNVNTLDGLRGTQHSEKLWEVLDTGGGWARYELRNSETGQVTPKESFVAPLDDQTLIGCGYFGKPRKANAGDQPAGPVAWSRAKENATLTAI